MEPTTIVTFLAIKGLLVVKTGTTMFISFMSTRKIKNLEKLATAQAAAIIKMQNALKTKNMNDSIAQNAEIIYQDLLSSIHPIVVAIGISKRENEQHPLWQTLGGMMDEYANNPYVLENLRKSIKTDPDVARAADLFIERSEKLLRHLDANDPDGILTGVFADGLLGQSMSLLSQAKQLAHAE